MANIHPKGTILGNAEKGNLAKIYKIKLIPVGIPVGFWKVYSNSQVLHFVDKHFFLLGNLAKAHNIKLILVGGKSSNLEKS